MLASSPKPVPGTEMGQRLGATRQTVVQEIAILRARGEPIIATSRGYLLASSLTPNRFQAILAVRHRPEQTEDELTLLLDLGLRIVDVSVDHPVYGELRGMLMLDSREDLRDWLRSMKEKQAHMLSELTEGIHLHTVEAPREELIERARQALRERGYLFEAETA
jgi:transcriptional regulator of NAD metabolism